MRVIAGRARGRKLKSPAGMDTRPTTDRIKETLFNILQGEVLGCVFVDLFAGSGAVGIEALSRGADHAYFVENQRAAYLCVRENLSAAGFTEQATLLWQDVLSALPLIREKEADIIFMDPPYRAGFEERVFEALLGMPYVTKETLLILEADIHREMDFLDALGYQVLREKKYKTNKHVFVKKGNYSAQDFALCCKVRKNVWIQPRGNPALCRRQTLNEPDFVTMKPKAE